MNKTFSDSDLDASDYPAVEQRVMDGCITASVIVLGKVAEKLGELDEETMADLALQLGEFGDLAEVAITNLNIWYRDEFPTQIDRVIADAKFSAMTE